MLPFWPFFPVLAHGFADAGPLPVPTPVLLTVGAGLALAAGALPPPRRAAVPALATAVGPRWAMVLRALAVVLLLAIVVPAAFGPTDVAANPSTRLLFTVGWAGALLLSVAIGPWWSAASPLTLAADDAAARPLPAELGVWPAVGLLAAFGFAEQVVEASSLVVLCTVGAYLLVGIAGALTYGRAWLQRSDPVQVTSGALGALAPLGVHAGRPVLRSARRGLVDVAAVPGLAAFLGALIGINLFDAAELSGGFGTRLGLYLACVAGAGLAAHLAATPAVLAPAFIPAAAGHLGAHYLAPLLVDTQIAAVLASDPLGRGWNLLGLTGAEIVAEPIPGTAGLAVMAVLLIAGHALAMAAARALLAPGRSAAATRALLFPVRAAILVSLVAGLYLRFAS